MPCTMSMKDIVQSYELLIAKSPARQVDIAHSLGLSEGELVAAHGCEYTQNQRLKSVLIVPQWHRLFGSMHSLGLVMGLTRNQIAVHEIKTCYEMSSTCYEHACIDQKNFCLELPYEDISYGFFVTENTPQGTKNSLQFFNNAGRAIHKIHCLDPNSSTTFASLVKQFAAPEFAYPDFWCTGLDRSKEPPPSLNHTLCGSESFGVKHLEQLLREVSEHQLALRIELHQGELRQAYQGSIHQVMMLGEWLNIMDPDFNLHLQLDRVSEVRLIPNEGVDSLVMRDAHAVPSLTFSVASHDELFVQVWQEILDQFKE